MSSALGTALGMFVLATSIQLKMDTPSGVQWIAYTRLFSFAFAIFICNCGVASMHYGVIAEILPERLKGLGMSLLATMLWMFYLITLKFFPFVTVAIGLHGAAYGFTAVCIACSAFILVYMPETKGKSYEEIQNSLR